MFKNKLIILLPVIVIAVVFIFSLASVPSISPAPHNLPIAIVNQDKGSAATGINVGETIVSNIQAAASASSDEEPAVKWIEVGSEEEVQAGLNNQEYYAALVIPEDLSEKQASLLTPEPVSPGIKLYINQGMNPTAAALAQQLLTQMANGLNEKMRTQLLAAVDQQGGTLSTKQAAAFASPIALEVVTVNAVGTHSANGNAPVSMFQPLWMASLIGGVIFLLTKNKTVFANRKERLQANVGQIVWGAVIALVVGFGYPWFVDLLGLNIPNYADTALFLSLTYFAFFLMISAVFSWIGFAGMAIFVLFLFFGAPLLSFAPEMLSGFYRDWVQSWLPMRFMVEGLRELLFFGEGFSLNQPTVVLIWIGVVSLLVLLASAFKPSAAAQRSRNV
ncbi:YhgE/Pip domain-containing protein [Cohnella fermenti]|uniref:DUF3533 domain-containing protein n=1 Tax=Cohnella fermenti TaxID=2565925 RepID=A0A4S4BNP0_9BACL|nr:ABC transporter permease [Cohnella fermenti]THF76443.1 DUF3533 domain-containing protein [Cohnella fermenti]